MSKLVSINIPSLLYYYLVLPKSFSVSSVFVYACTETLSAGIIIKCRTYYYNYYYHQLFVYWVMFSFLITKG